MAESVLDMGEEPVLTARCTCKMFAHGRGTKGTLFLTSGNRLVFVISSGTFSKKHRKDHSVHIGKMLNLRIEEGAFGFGKSLVVEWNFEGTPLTYRYSGIKEPQEWINQMKERVKAAKKMSLAYDRIVRLIKSQEVTPFDQIEVALCSMSPEFAEKTEDAKDREIVDLLSQCIDQGLIEGFVDTENKKFTHLVAYKQKEGKTQVKETIKQTVVMIPCPYCKGLMPNTSVFCPHCGAKKQA